MVFRLTGDDTQIYLTKDTHTSMSALLESGKLPTTRVRRRISLFNRSIMLFVRSLILWLVVPEGLRT